MEVAIACNNHGFVKIVFTKLMHCMQNQFGIDIAFDLSATSDNGLENELISRDCERII